jgi:hypothetical protein
LLRESSKQEDAISREGGCGIGQVTRWKMLDEIIQKMMI